MSKWSIFLNNSGYCTSQRGTGNRPCDRGVPCDTCHYNYHLAKEFDEVKDSIDESLYCSICSHELKPHEHKICTECIEFEEEYE